MRKIIAADKWLYSQLFKLDTDFSEKYKKGIEQNVMAYVKKKYSSAIINKNGSIYIDEGRLGEDFSREYFKKTEEDYSAKDFANAALSRMGIPPKEAMSAGSLEKRFLELFNSKAYKAKVYVKIVQGGKNVACLDRSLLKSIICNNEVVSLIQKQALSAERHREDNAAWHQYDHEKAYIQMIDDKIKEYSNDEHARNISDNGYVSGIETRTYLMLKQLFSLFFTDFDFVAYDADVDNIENLESAMDFGEDYQQLHETLMSPNFNWKYYQPRDDSNVLDVLAEKVADRIIKKLSEKES